MSFEEGTRAADLAEAAERRARVVVAAALTVALFAIVARFPLLDRRSYWLDELSSVVRAWTTRLPDVLERHLAEPNPPLYPYALWAWTRIFGSSSETITRLLSALVETLGIGVFAGVLWGRLGRVRTSVATAFLACSGLGFWHGREARMYAVVFGFGAIVTALAVVMALDVLQARLRRGTVVLFGGIGMLTSATHLYGALLVGALGGALAVAFTLGKRWDAVRGTVVAVLIGVSPAVAWVVYAWARLSELLGGSSSIERPDGRLAFVVMSEIFNGWLGLVTVGGVALGAVAVIAWRRSGSPVLWIMVGSLALIVAAAVISSLHTPTVNARNLIVVVPVLAVIVGVVAEDVAPGSLPAAVWLVAAMAVGFASWVGGLYMRPVEDWRSVAERVVETHRSDPDVVLIELDPHVAYWDFYLGRESAGELTASDLIHVSEVTSLPQRFVLFGAHVGSVAESSAFLRQAASHCVEVRYVGAVLFDCWAG